MDELLPAIILLTRAAKGFADFLLAARSLLAGLESSRLRLVVLVSVLAPAYCKDRALARQQAIRSQIA